MPASPRGVDVRVGLADTLIGRDGLGLIRRGRRDVVGAGAGHTPTVRFATKPALTPPVTVASWCAALSLPKTLSDASDI